jgi:hypothetical protein
MKTPNSRWIQWVVAIAGIFYTFVGVTQLVAPAWFFTNVGPYPPFNRHYMGDLGSFTLPMGIALLIAARHPFQHRLFIGFVAAGSLIHSLNHLYDDLVGAAPDPFGTAVLLIFGLVMVWVFFAGGRVERQAV